MDIHRGNGIETILEQDIDIMFVALGPIVFSETYKHKTTIIVFNSKMLKYTSLVKSEEFLIFL